MLCSIHAQSSRVDFWNAFESKVKSIDNLLYQEEDFLLQNVLFKMRNLISYSLGEATKKNCKKFHNSCELSPKMENPPYFTTISATFGT